MNATLTCLRIELDGSTEFVITTNLEMARKYVADIHAEVIASRMSSRGNTAVSRR